MNSICVYCGSSDKINPAYLEGATQMGRAIARRGLQLWYGAGSTGLMGAVANGALEAGGEVIGVIPTLFNTPQLAHPGLTRLEVVDSMHQRKERLANQAEAFIALPGGFGTFEELFEILTWAQIGLHQKPVGLLNTLHYYDCAGQHGGLRPHGRIYLRLSTAPCLSASKSQRNYWINWKQYNIPSGLDRWLTRPD